MFKFMFTMLFSLSVHAGVGGISGAHVLFQEESTFVNAYYNKSVCHDGFEFKAKVSKCVKWNESGDEKRCIKNEKIIVFQPIESTRKRCADYNSDDGPCTTWEEVKFIQSPNRIIKFLDDSNNVKKTKKLIIPECR